MDLSNERRGGTAAPGFESEWRFDVDCVFLLGLDAEAVPRSRSVCTFTRFTFLWSISGFVLIRLCSLRILYRFTAEALACFNDRYGLSSSKFKNRQVPCIKQGLCQ